MHHELNKTQPDDRSPKDLYYDIIESVRSDRLIHIYISRAIEYPHYYIDLISRLRQASPNDIIYIHLNTPGGHLDTGVQIINAMRDSQATIVTVLDGTVCSLGSLIFLAGHEFIVHDNSRLMIHNYSGGVVGKGNEQHAQLTSTIEWFNALCREIYSPFLTDVEIESMVNGVDIWLNSDQVKDRLAVVVEHMKKLYEQEEKTVELDVEEQIYQRVKMRKDKEEQAALRASTTKVKSKPVRKTVTKK